MAARILTIVPMIVLALGAATVLAQPPAPRSFAPIDQANFTEHDMPFRQHDPASAIAVDAAYVGDGSDPRYLWEQQKLLTEPGYSIGTGAARVRGPR